MNLYRATYWHPLAKEVKLRRMTFAASSEQAAVEVAEDWQINDSLIEVQYVRPLKPFTYSTSQEG